VGIRERFADLMLGGERQRMQDSLAIMEDAYLRGPYVVTPDHLATLLKETESTQLWDLVQRLETQYTIISGMTTGDEQARARAVKESRLLWMWDVIAQWIVWLWTNYGFGTAISVSPTDEGLQEVWTDFWTADENANILADDRIAVLSERLLVDGEFFLVFFVSKLDGTVTLRLVRTEEVTEIVTEPEDEMTPVYYKRELKATEQGDVKTIYYPDYLGHINGKAGTVTLPDDATRAETVNDDTDVMMMHIAYNRKTNLRGWPIYTAGSVWSRAHTKFREDRASVTASTAMYVNKLKGQNAGQRVVDALATRLQSSLVSSGTGRDTNPPAVAGSTWTENEAAELTRLSQGTAASDAKIDGESLLMMAGIGGGIFPHYLGAGDAFRLATATAMETPLMRQWSRYQQFWGAQFRRMVRIVAWAATTYPTETEHAEFEDMSVDVNTDRLIEDDLTAIATALGGILRDGLLPYLSLLPDEMALEMVRIVWTNILEALGVADVGEVLKAEWFKVPEEPEEEPGDEAPVVVVVPDGGNGQDQEPPDDAELQTASALVSLMKGWDARMEMVEGTLRESHEPVEVKVLCPLEGCEGQVAYRYPDHPASVLVCATCERTFDTERE